MPIHNILVDEAIHSKSHQPQAMVGRRCVSLSQPTPFAVFSLRNPTLTWLGEVTCCFGWVDVVALASPVFKTLDYGGGIDIWNVSKAQHIRFTKVHKL